MHFKCNYKYDKFATAVLFSEPKSKVTLELIRQTALATFEFPEGTEAQDLHLYIYHTTTEKTILVYAAATDHLLQSIAVSGSMTIGIKTSQKAFSNWSFNEFKKQFNIEADCYSKLPKFDLDPVETNEGHIIGSINSARDEIIMLRQICPIVFDCTEFARCLAVYEILKKATVLYDSPRIDTTKASVWKVGYRVSGLPY